MHQTRTGQRPSRLIASLLSGAWRETPPAPEISSEELELIAPLLIGSGGGALAFWKLRGTDLESTNACNDLKQSYRLCTLRAAIHEREIKQVIKLLAEVGVEPILVKGWSIARHYPEQALRPYGDIDLLVQPQVYSAAQEVLASDEGRNFVVDLHLGADHLCDQPFDDLWARSRHVELGDVKVRVLSPEDHMRILCVHYLRHGAWWAAGLCDIGLMVETFRENFDWDVCLTTNRRRAGWVACTVGLAHQLLGANISETPFVSSAKSLPRWLVPAVLKEWNDPLSIDHPFPPPLADKFSQPIEIVKEIRRRWPPNPMLSTIAMNGPFNEWPRIFFQAGNALSRTVKFCARLSSDRIDRIYKRAKRSRSR